MVRRAIIGTLAALAFCGCSAAYAQDAPAEVGCGDEWTAAEDQTDGELRLAYAALFEALDPAHTALLDRGQEAWLEHRRATCALIAERPGYPEIAASAMTDCLSFMARERTLELRLLRRLSGRP